MIRQSEVMMSKRRDPERVIRQWIIVLQLMRHRHGATLPKLRDVTGVSRMTIWRDLQALRLAGLPIDETTINGERRVSIRTTELPALILSPLQIQALDLGRRLLLPLDGTPLLDAYDDILVRVGRSLRGVPEVGSEGARQAGVRRTLSEAIAAGRVVRFGFVKVRESERLKREVEPLGWRFVRGELYLLAFDRLARARRSFASTRIHEVEVLDAASGNASEAPGADLFGTAEGLTTLESERVVIEMTPVGAAHLALRPLSASQVEHWRPDGSLRLEAQVSGLQMTADWLMTWYGDARAVSPPALVAEVVSRFRRGLEVHLAAPAAEKASPGDRDVSNS